MFALDVVNEGCSDALRIKLEWESSDNIDLWVTDPNGDRVSYDTPATVRVWKALLHLLGSNCTEQESQQESTKKWFRLDSSPKRMCVLSNFRATAPERVGSISTQLVFAVV